MAGHRVLFFGSPGRLDQEIRRLVWRPAEGEPTAIPYDEPAVIVLDGPGQLVSATALGALAQRGVAVLISDEKHLPAGLMLPLAGHTLHTQILRGQTACSAPRKKQVWRQIVCAKITAQADLLASLGAPDRKLAAMAALVRSGDPDNVEGRAAARYWPRLMGEGFWRDAEAPGVNSHLNYGYALLRSAVARAICGAGLHPALGVFHSNRENPFALADDLMEPLRPMVDRRVWEMAQAGEIADELEPPGKKALLQVLVTPVDLAGKETRLFHALERMAASLRRCLCEEGRRLEVAMPRK